RSTASAAVDAPQEPREPRPLTAQAAVTDDGLLERDEMVVHGGDSPQAADQRHDPDVEMAGIEDDEEAWLRRPQHAPRKSRVDPDCPSREWQLPPGEKPGPVITPKIEADDLDVAADVPEEAEQDPVPAVVSGEGARDHDARHR